MNHKYVDFKKLKTELNNSMNEKYFCPNIEFNELLNTYIKLLGNLYYGIKAIRRKEENIFMF